MARLRKHPILAAFGALLLVAVIVVAWAAVVVWRAAHHDDASEVAHADVIVVLGAAQYNGTPSPVFQGRLDHALLLWTQGRAGIVYTVGSKQPGDRTTEAAAGRDYLVANGVPAASVVVLPVGHTTLQSLQAVAAEMRRGDLGSAFLVSDPWHNARLEAMSTDLGFRGYTSATWTSAATSEGARGQGYLRETFAYLEYRLLGR